MSAHDPREAATQYRLEQLRREQARAGERDPEVGAVPSDAEIRAAAATRGSTATDRAAVVETAIQQAIRRGEFDDLPGSGKPLPLGGTHDPDWWIRRKIQTEQLRGLGPPALTLRVESTELDSRLDELGREQDVREVLEDFNRRVVEARRQLLGGPPVVTPTRDVEAELAAWHVRRAARLRAEADAEGRGTEPPGRRWFRRRG